MSEKYSITVTDLANIKYVNVHNTSDSIHFSF